MTRQEAAFPPEMRKERNHPRLEYVTDVHPRLHFCRAAALLRLKGGLDKLVCRDGNHERYELCLDGRTLADAHIPGCGNCGTLMRRGYGDGLLSQEECQAVRDRINDGYDGLKAATAYLAPFVGLMASGLYIAADFDLFPVMNYGRLHEYFWESPEYNSELHSTHVFVGGGAEKLDAPMYLTPTQRAALINPARVEEYRRRLQEGEAFPRAVAMYLNGGVALLLDGHHKAVACALEGIPVRTLVIFRIEDEQTVKTAMEAGKRLYLHHSKALYRSADTLILRDGQGNELTRMSCLERMKRKKVEKAETEDVPWGELPEEYRTEAYGKFPNAGRLSAATLIPPDQLRSTIEEEMRKPQGRHDMKVVSHLLWYAEMFPESKWLSAEERAWLARPWHEF